MSGKTLAPDRLPWPMPVVAVDKSEAKPWPMGWHPYADRFADRTIVASSEPDHSSAIVKKYGAPFHLVSAELPTADYWLCGPQGPVPGFVGVERKERDLASSLTAEMARFKEECDRLRTFTNPLIVTSCTLEDLFCRECQRCHRRNRPDALFCDRCGSPDVRTVKPGPHEAAFIGGISVIAARYRIPMIPPPGRPHAERFAARFIWEVWQSWLAVSPDVLAWAREEERRRGIVREHNKRQRKAVGA